MRSYGAARSLFSFLAFIAWSVVVIGVLVAFVSAAGVSQYAGGGAGLLAMVPGVGIGIAGFILVAFVQDGRASVDTAEYTQQMLKIARDQLEVSKQGLKSNSTTPQSFSDVAPSETTAPNAPRKKSAPKPKPKPEPPRKVEYHGKEILIERGKYKCNGIPFPTMKKAEHYIDTYSSKNLPDA